MSKENLFKNSLQRKVEQEAIEKKAIAKGNPDLGELARVTFSLHKNVHKKFKKYAADQERTMSSILTDWINQNCHD